MFPVKKSLRVHRVLGVIIVLFFFCVSLLFASCSKEIQSSESFDEEKWLCEITSPKYSGRKTGTEGAKKAAHYILNELSRMGHSPILEVFSYRDSIIMRNIVVEITGENDSTIIIGAHYDGAVSSLTYQAANDNASGIVALLSIAKSIQSIQNTILLCFWDGEENTEGTSFNGSAYFLEHFEDIDSIKWYCNIDCCGRSGDPIYLYYSPDKEDIFKAINVADSCSLEVIKKVQDGNSSDYVSFKNRRISFWGWNDYNVFRYIHRPTDSANYISIAKIQTVSDLTLELISLL